MSQGWIFFLVGRCWILALPWNPVRVEVFVGVRFSEDLHSKDGKDVDDDDEEEGQVAQGAQRADDDAQENLHRRPGLSKFQNPHLK